MRLFLIFHMELGMMIGMSYIITQTLHTVVPHLHKKQLADYLNAEESL